ncbi:MAG: NAD(P)H-dependent oxidoreductase [Candidatus Woesearchaeota archaeon]
MDFKEITKKRFATKKFTGEKISDEKIEELKELIRYSASSFGLQPYEIVVVKNDELKEKLLPLAYNQPQITTGSHIFVFCANSDVKSRIDKYQEFLGGENISEGAKGYIGMMRGSLEGLSEEQRTAWAARQAYIALGNAINGAKYLGFDSCPMEGFDADGFKKALELDDNLTPVAIVAVGISAVDMPEKIRYSKEDLFIEK